MNNGLDVQVPTPDPIDWMWYREFGGSVALPPAVRLKNRRIARRALFKASGLAILAPTAVVGSFVLSARGVLHWAVAGIMAFLAIAGLGLLAADVIRRAVTARRRNRMAAARAARADRIHGTPGDATPSSALHRSPTPIRALQPSRGMATLLELLLALPGPAVFHRLRLPSTDTIVDHAVVCGDAVFLLDSINFGGGMWEWAAGTRDIAIPTFRAGKPCPRSLHKCADELRCLLGPAIEVVPIVVVHGARVARGGTSLSPHGVHLLTAAAALERIGNTCAYGFAGTARRPEVEEALGDLLV